MIYAVASGTQMPSRFFAKANPTLTMLPTPPHHYFTSLQMHGYTKAVLESTQTSSRLNRMPAIASYTSVSIVIL